jgi:ferrous iron transport protein B
LLQQVQRRGLQFARRATRVIVLMSLGLSVLSLGGGQAILIAIGQGLAWCLTPMGLQPAQWPAAIALLTGMLAKEVVVGTLNTLYAQDALVALPVALTSMTMLLSHIWHAILQVWSDGGQLASGALSAVAQSGLKQRMESPLSAMAYLSFILLYLPCVSTLAVIARELSWRWAGWGLLWSTTLAFSISVAIYQVGTLMQHPAMSVQILCWLGVGVAMVGYGLVAWVRHLGAKEGV